MLKTKEIQAVITTAAIGADIKDSNLNVVVGEAAKLEPAQAVNYIKSGQAEIAEAVNTGKSVIDAQIVIAEGAAKDAEDNAALAQYWAEQAEQVAAEVNDGVLTVQKNGTTVGTFTANQATNSTINITVPTAAADVGALPNSTKYGASLSLTVNSSTFVVTAQLKDQDGNNLGSAQTIDLPLESVVVSGAYDNANKKIVLTLQNGTTVDIPVADLVAGLQAEITASNKLSADLVDDSSTTNKFVTATDKSTWNGKANDNAVVHLANAETISGQKTFSANPLIHQATESLLFIDNTAADTQTTPDSTVWVGSVKFRGKDNKEVFNIRGGLTTTGSQLLYNIRDYSDATKHLQAGFNAQLEHSTGRAFMQFTVNANGSGDTRTPDNRSLTKATNSTTDTYIPTMGWVNNPSTSTNVVHRSGNETIAGQKTYSDTAVFNGIVKNLAGGYRVLQYQMKSGNTYEDQAYFDDAGTFLGSFRVWNTGSAEFLTFTEVKAPTPATADNSTKIATTAFVKAQGYATTAQLPEIDQTYDGTSANAQSGIAIEGELANYATTSSLAAVATSGDYSDLINTPAVDQVYDATSANAQSGIAVTEAIAGIGGVVDQTYDSTSANAQSGTAVAGAISALLGSLYPVGALYIGTQATCPMASLISGSTWDLVSAGKALWTGNGQSGSGTTTNANFANAKANTTIAAGLPDHKHAVSKQYGTTDQASGNGVDGTSHNVGTMNMTCGNASADNSIYGNSTTVQPPAYVVNVWRRTA